MDELNFNEEERVIDSEDTSSGNETITHPFNPNEIEIETPSYSIGYLIDRLEHNEINMNTDFQRENNLWTADKQSRLIESVLLGLPLPAFYFDTSNPKWDIIDGLQRCCSIENFCVNKKLKLIGLEFLKEKDGKPYLEGKGFDDLDRTLQRSIITKPITVNLIKKADKKIRFILFKRLNTGGLELTPQEIRNAVYQGKPAETIKEFAKLDSFKRATDYRVPSNRMQDRDFVSRFLAFYLIEYTKYSPGLDDFINKSMDILENYNTSDIEMIKQDFIKSLNLAYKIFKNDAFRKRTNKNDVRRPINKAYFEVITVLLSKLSNSEIEQLNDNKEILKSNLIRLLRNDRYSNSLSGGTGTKDSVTIRFSWFKKVLDKSINGIKITITDDNKIEDIEL
jgi:ABC-type dipeptide/oligopeptide/nickel transport system ATPase component